MTCKVDPKRTLRMCGAFAEPSDGLEPSTPSFAPYAFEGISTWLQRLDRFAQVVERTKGDR
jgi:hypothetical protein